MKYFNCNWLRDLPKDISIRTNMCQGYSTLNPSVTKVAYQTDKKYSTKISIILSTLKFQNLNETSTYPNPHKRKNFIKSDEKGKNFKIWWIASGVSLFALLVFLIFVIICVYKRN